MTPGIFKITQRYSLDSFKSIFWIAIIQTRSCRIDNKHATCLFFEDKIIYSWSCFGHCDWTGMVSLHELHKSQPTPGIFHKRPLKSQRGKRRLGTQGSAEWLWSNSHRKNGLCVFSIQRWDRTTSRPPSVLSDA